MKPGDKQKFDKLRALEYKAYSNYHYDTGFDFQQWLSKADYAHYKDLMKEVFDVDIQEEKMAKQKILLTRNPRVSFSGDEIDYLLGLVDKQIGKGKLDHEKMLFQSSP